MCALPRPRTAALHAWLSRPHGDRTGGMCRCHRSLLDYCGNSLRHFIFMHLFHNKSATENSYNNPPPSAPTTQCKTAAKAERDTHKTMLRLLMTDSAASSIILITLIITAGSHEHIHSPNIPGGAVSLPLAQSCGVRVCRWWPRCRRHLLGGFCEGEYHGSGRYPCSPNEERRAGCRAPSPPSEISSQGRFGIALTY